MTNPRFKKTERMNRFKAVSFTIFFHVAVLGGLYYFSGEDRSVKELLPDVVKEWLFEDVEEAPVKPVKNNGKRV